MAAAAGATRAYLHSLLLASFRCKNTPKIKTINIKRIMETIERNLETEMCTQFDQSNKKRIRFADRACKNLRKHTLWNGKILKMTLKNNISETIPLNRVGSGSLILGVQLTMPNFSFSNVHTGRGTAVIVVPRTATKPSWGGHWKKSLKIFQYWYCQLRWQRVTNIKKD